MRNLYLVRHGTPDFPDGIKLCIGSTEIDIGPEGRAEAERLKKFFRDRKVDAIYCSPLIRCRHTAEIIADGRTEVVEEAGLAEIHMGHWEGIPLKSIKKKLGDEPVYGEKRTDALSRFEGALRKIMADTSGDVICVAHAGVNCAFIAKAEGKDIRTSRGIKQPCGCYNRFEYDGENFKAAETGCLPEITEEKRG